MKTFLRAGVFSAICATMTLGAWGQVKGPHIGYLFPAGGCRGTVIQVTAGGQALNGVDGVHISGEGASAKVVQHVRPLNPKVLRELQRQAGLLIQQRMGKPLPAAGKAREPEDQKIQMEAANHPIMRHLETLAPPDLQKALKELIEMLKKRQMNPQIAEMAILEVTVDAGAAPGIREMRLSGKGGLTNPLQFHVGTMTEIIENEPFGLQSPATQTAGLPAVLNGQVMPGDADRYRFHARGGERLYIDVQARALMPYLADAVPGWFQPTLAIYDGKGKEVAFVDDDGFDPDPAMLFAAPEDGDYELEIRDSIYRGREDFVYRILLGGNAPEPRHADTKPAGVKEDEPNNDMRHAQKVTLPQVIKGSISKPGDNDVYKFESDAGELVAEIYARRNGSPLDSVLRLMDASGTVLEWNDDHEDTSTGLATHHADSWLRAKLPKKGVYYLQVFDAQRQGGKEFAYQLRVGPPRPDFELRVTPSTVNPAAGRCVPIAVHAIRRDGFDGAIDLALKDGAPGFRLSGARIPAQRDSVRVMLHAPAPAPDAPVALNVEGRAQIAGTEVARIAMPAEDMMQAFAYRHLVPQQQLMAAVKRAKGKSPQIRVMGKTPLKIKAGAGAEVRVRSPKPPGVQKIRLQLDEPPSGIAIEGLTETADGFVFSVKADAAVKSGFADNLIVEALAETVKKRPDSKNAPQPVSLGFLPAIPFEVVRP